MFALLVIFYLYVTALEAGLGFLLHLRRSMSFETGGQARSFCLAMVQNLSVPEQERRNRPQEFVDDVVVRIFHLPHQCRQLQPNLCWSHPRECESAIPPR